MATREQIAANRRNSLLSTGPRDTSRTRFNGLTHGLCSRHVSLPGEDPGEFDAEVKGWAGDWQPPTHTRAVLVEIAAVATLRLRRSIRSEAALFAKLAGDAGRAFDREQDDRVERAVDRFEDDPHAALALLESHAPGIDRLLRAWGEMAEALESGPAGWTERFHTRLMRLLGHGPGTSTFHAGALPTASSRLVASARPGMPALPPGEAEATVASLRQMAAQVMDQLRERRLGLPDCSEDRRRAMDVASADTSDERAAAAPLREGARGSRSAGRRWVSSWPWRSPAAPTCRPSPSPRPESTPAPPENNGVSHYESITYGKLASVGEAARPEGFPAVPAGPPGRPDGPVGGDPGSEKPPKRS